MSDPNDSEAHLFPGLVPMDEFGRRAKRCRRTLKRWEDQGKLVVQSWGTRGSSTLKAPRRGCVAKIGGGAVNDDGAG